MQLIVLVILALPPRPAHAAPADDLSTKVRNLFEEGQKDYELGEFEQSLEKFKAAYRIHPDPAFLFNLGQCHRKLHNWNEALNAYQGYVRKQPAGRNRLAAEGYIAECEREIAKQKIAVVPPLPKPRIAAPVALLALGAAAGATGAALLLWVKSDLDGLDQACAPYCNPVALDPLRLRADIGYSLLGVGGATLVADIALWVIAFRRSGERPKIAVLPMPGGLVISGAW